jgi:hypothetical protein
MVIVIASVEGEEGAVWCGVVKRGAVRVVCVPVRCVQMHVCVPVHYVQIVSPTVRAADAVDHLGVGHRQHGVKPAEL